MLTGEFEVCGGMSCFEVVDAHFELLGAYWDVAWVQFCSGVPILFLRFLKERCLF